MNTYGNNGPMPYSPPRPRESNGRFASLDPEARRTNQLERSATGSAERTTQATALKRWVERRPGVAVGIAIVVGVLVGIWVKR